MKGTLSNTTVVRRSTVAAAFLCMVFCATLLTHMPLSLAIPSASFAAPLPATPEPITIAAVGDIMIGSTYPDASRLPPNDGSGLLDSFAPVLRDADLTFGNLEGPLLDGGASAKCPAHRASGPVNCFAFRVPTRYGRYLKDAGFNVLSVANNHAGDFGSEGRISTQAVLDALSIRSIGGDRNRYATAIVQVRGRRIGWIGFAFNEVSPNVNNLAAAHGLIAGLKRRADIVVVSFHNGAEGSAYQHVVCATEIFHGEARGNPCAFAHTAVDAGADLVLGHGPHVLRGMEIYKGRLIVYSMGNFCTYGWFTLSGSTALTAVFDIKLDLDGRFLRGRLFAGRQVEPGGPVPDANGEAIRVVRDLSVADFGADAPIIADDGSFRCP